MSTEEIKTGVSNGYSEFQDKILGVAKAADKVMTTSLPAAQPLMCVQTLYCTTTIRRAIIPTLENRIIEHPDQEFHKNMLINIERGLQSLEDFYEKILLMAYTLYLEEELEQTNVNCAQEHYND